MKPPPLLLPIGMMLCAVLYCCAACSRHEPARPTGLQSDADGSKLTSTSSDASASDSLDGATLSTQTVDASTPGAIGPEGGVVEGDGVRIAIPQDAFKNFHVLRVKAATDHTSSSWPPGTAAGYLFEPVDQRFRVPITIDFPHTEPEADIMCESSSGERHYESFDSSHSSKPFRINVAVLPKRCGVYTMTHSKARRAAREKEEEIVAKHNKSFKWDIKGKICDPQDLVRPNAGKELAEPPGIGGCLAGMARIPNRKSCVDRWEAHLVELLDDGTERAWTPYFNPGGLRIRAKSSPNAIPQAYISQIQAGEACKVAKKRLCNDDEWIAACRGAKGTQFPYGKEEKRGTCNDHRDTHPAVEYLEKSDLSVFTKLEHPCINQIPGSLLKTGEKKECVTSENAFDMVGNLHEWTADPKGHFRGGYYVDTKLNGRGCDYVTSAHEARYWDYSTGFRCCADAK